MPVDYFIHLNTQIDRRTADLDTTDITAYFTKAILTSGKIRMQITNIELPNLAYTFPYHSCVLWYVIDPAGANTLKSATIRTDRNYNNATDLITDLNALVVGDNLVFSYDANTCRITLTNNNASTIKLVSSYRYSENTSCYNDVMDRLGFDQDLRTTTIAHDGTLEANSCVKLLRSNCYYLTCGQIGSFAQQSTCVGMNKPNILARITGNNFGFLSQLTFTNEMIIDTPENNIDKLELKLLDDMLYPVSINNGSITMTIKVSIF
jgi:hypothetical protein